MGWVPLKLSVEFNLGSLWSHCELYVKLKIKEVIESTKICFTMHMEHVCGIGRHFWCVFKEG